MHEPQVSFTCPLRRDALGHVGTATTEAHYEKTVPEAVLKGMRLLEEKATK